MLNKPFSFICCRLTIGVKFTLLSRISRSTDPSLRATDRVTEKFKT